MAIGAQAVKAPPSASSSTRINNSKKNILCWADHCYAYSMKWIKHFEIQNKTYYITTVPISIGLVWTDAIVFYLFKGDMKIIKTDIDIIIVCIKLKNQKLIDTQNECLLIWYVNLNEYFAVISEHFMENKESDDSIIVCLCFKSEQGVLWELYCINKERITKNYSMSWS